MIIKCPNCQSRLSEPESPFPRHDVPCSVCGKKFFAAGELGFPYGEIVDSDPAVEKIACPCCHQHYDLSVANPTHGLVGCMICAGVFAVPPPWELLPKAGMPVASPPPLPENLDMYGEMETDDSGLKELPPETGCEAETETPEPEMRDLNARIAKARTAADKMRKSTLG